MKKSLVGKGVEVWENGRVGWEEGGLTGEFSDDLGFAVGRR